MTVHGMHREASIEINASPDAVYDLVSDLPRMGEWSSENIGGEWQPATDEDGTGHYSARIFALRTIGIQVASSLAR